MVKNGNCKMRIKKYTANLAGPLVSKVIKEHQVQDNLPSTIKNKIEQDGWGMFLGEDGEHGRNVNLYLDLDKDFEIGIFHDDYDGFKLILIDHLRNRKLWKLLEKE